MIKRLPLPEWSELNALFTYNDGKVIWKETKEVACILQPSQPYRKVKLNNKLYLSHRLIFKLIHRKEPGPYIDHINQDKLDNRIENLREVTCAENAANTSIPRKTVLVDVQIPLVRACIDMGLSQPEVARMFGVSSDCISAIARRRTWTHVL